MLSFSSSASYRGAVGTLKIENGSLVFVTRGGGFVSQREYVSQSIPIRAIRATEVQETGLLRTRRDTLVIMVDASAMVGIPRHEFIVPNPDQWIDAIQNEMRAPAPSPTQPTYVKEIIKEIVKVPCPYCSALVEVTAARCSSCGAPLKR